MTKAPSAPKSKAKSAEPDFAEGDLGKIQALLFGDKAQQLEKELSVIQASLAEMTTRMNNELGQRIAAIEADNRHQLNALTARVDQELEALSSDKVDRETFADILSDIAAEIRES